MRPRLTRVRGMRVQRGLILDCETAACVSWRVCPQVALPMCALVFLFVMFMRTKLLQAGNFGALA